MPTTNLVTPSGRAKTCEEVKQNGTSERWSPNSLLAFVKCSDVFDICSNLSIYTHMFFCEGSLIFSRAAPERMRLLGWLLAAMCCLLPAPGQCGDRSSGRTWS